jgi:hypothetical protein
VQLLLALGWSGAPALLWTAFGVFGTASSLVYAILSHRFPAAQAGRVITALNALVFTWAFLAQWGIGAIIERWPASVGQYHPDGFRAAFAAFLAVQVLAYTWMLHGGRDASRSP